MLDIKRIVDDTENVKKALLKRMTPEKLNLDEIVDLYNKKKAKQTEFDNLRGEQNGYNDQMSKADKKSEDFKQLIVKLKEVAENVKRLEEELRLVDAELTAKVEVLPNIPDDDLLPGEKENNKVIKEVGKLPEFAFEIRDHVELLTKNNMVDFERAAKIGGAQMTMYVGDGAILEWALINFFIKEHLGDGYTMAMPPHMLTEASGYTAGQLPKFREDVYWTQDGNFMLPTAESALASMHRDEIVPEEELPKKYFAYTPCYRREAGSYRANERGLMRMHQFNKVEMFQYTNDTTSDAAFEELVGKACKLVEKLGLYFRVSKLAAGDCSGGMARTYDVEAWMPFMKTFYEVSSCSNARDYQARRGNMRFKPTDAGKPRFMHTLNASGLATSRLMVALIETYQNADGTITVPDVLRPFVGKDRLGVAR
jgi:seryl-tRNA synthetase